MKRKIRYKYKEQTVEREVFYIPFRYILSIFVSVLEICAILGIVIYLCYHSAWFYSLAVLAQFVCMMKIVASHDNPDYKIPWLMFVIIVPVIGFMMYLMFYSRTLKKKYINGENNYANEKCK